MQITGRMVSKNRISLNDCSDHKLQFEKDILIWALIYI